jgi:ELWxxDGT repeat protein
MFTRSLGLCAALALLVPVAVGQTTTFLRAFDDLDEIQAVGDEYLLFGGDEGLGKGFELYRWRADTGVTLLKDIAPGVKDSNPHDFCNAWLGGQLVTLFAADDSVSGEELWRTDGTTAGTFKVQDIAPGFFGANIAGIVYHPGLHRAFVSTSPQSGGGSQLWYTDGTTAGTLKIQTAAGVVLDMTPIGSDLYYNAGFGGTYRTDGTVGGAVPTPGLTGTKAQDLLRVGENLAVVATPTFPTGDSDLFVIDTTTQTATQLGDFFVGGNDVVRILGKSEVTDEVYFVARISPQAWKLFRSDLTVAGTHPVSAIPPGSELLNGAYGEAGGGSQLLFHAQHEMQTSQTDFLYSIDGLNPQLLINLGVESHGLHLSTVFANGGAYVLGHDSTTADGLYFTDGTPSGTLNVYKGPSSASSMYTFLAACDGRLFFDGRGGPAGAEGFLQYTPPGAQVIDLGFYAGEPRLRSTDPILGSPLQLQGDGASPGSLGVLAFGLPPVAPLDLGTGTPDWVDLATASLLPALLSADWSTTVTLPSTPTLAGAVFHLQAWFLDPSTGLIATSNSLRLHLEL